MSRRRTKRAVAIKRCDCLDQEMCTHPWWTRRLTVRGEKRQRINITKLFPNEPVEVAAAKAKDLARKGLIKNGELATGQPDDTRLTCRYVADKYIDARGGKKHYYLSGILEIDVPTGDNVTVKLGDKPIDDVSTRDIKHVVEVWRGRARTKAGIKQGAVAERHLKQTARHFFRWAVEEGYASHTPFKSPQGDTLIHIKASKGRRRRLQDGEAERILHATDATVVQQEFEERRANVTDAHQLRRLARSEAIAIAEAAFVADFFAGMLETGCRPGELRTLQWSEVRDGHMVILDTKAKDRDERAIPIEPTLEKILARRHIGPDGKELGKTAYVFGNETGDVFSKERVCEMWRRVCARAEVTDLHLHDLRAEFASQLSEANVPVEQVRDALGHSSITMTNTYLRSRGSLKDAYKRRTQHQARQRLKVVARR